MDIKTKYNLDDNVWFATEQGFKKGNVLNISVSLSEKVTDIKYSVSYFKTGSNLIVVSIPEQNLYGSRDEIVKAFV